MQPMYREPRISVISVGDMETSRTVDCAVAAARLGAEVAFAGRVDHGQYGVDMIARLTREGIDTSELLIDPVSPPDEALASVSRATGEPTTLRTQGGSIAKDAKLNIDALFSADICFVDVDDLALYRFLADLPVHTNPSAKLLGALTHLAESPGASASQIITRLDAVVGTAREAMSVLKTTSVTDACSLIQKEMTGSNLRFAAITDGAHGVFGVTPVRVLHIAAARMPVGHIRGAYGGFAGAMAYALAAHWDHGTALQLCSVVTGLSGSPPGSHINSPRMDQVRAILETNPPLLTELS